VRNTFDIVMCVLSAAMFFGSIICMAVGIWRRGRNRPLLLVYRFAGQELSRETVTLKQLKAGRGALGVAIFQLAAARHDIELLGQTRHRPLPGGGEQIIAPARWGDGMADYTVDITAAD
jgi:hypothetical protein